MPGSDGGLVPGSDGIVCGRKFPGDVLSNEGMMELLACSATRIEHMQVRRGRGRGGEGKK